MSVDRSADALDRGTNDIPSRVTATPAQHLQNARSHLTALQDQDYDMGRRQRMRMKLEPDESLEASLQRDRNEYYANLLKAHEQARRTVAGDHVPSSRRK